MPYVRGGGVLLLKSIQDAKHFFPKTILTFIVFFRWFSVLPSSETVTYLFGSDSKKPPLQTLALFYSCGIIHVNRENGIAILITGWKQTLLLPSLVSTLQYFVELEASENALKIRAVVSSKSGELTGSPSVNISWNQLGFYHLFHYQSSAFGTCGFRGRLGYISKKELFLCVPSWDPSSMESILFPILFVY